VVATALAPADARRLWQVYEPYHAIVYFAVDGHRFYSEAGLKGGWMGYFASRSAAMGPVGPEVVLATFYNFHPRMVHRAIPDAWKFSSPEVVLDARLRVADEGLRGALGDLITSDHVTAARDLAWQAVEAARPEGRSLFAAHAALDRPTESHLSLWLAATCLREHRGDGHVATLVAEEVGGLEAHILISEAGSVPAEMLRQFRGWSDEEWAVAVEGLSARGLLDESGHLTDLGRELHERIERRTDELALEPLLVPGSDGFKELFEHLRILTDAILDSGAFPYPNPIALIRYSGGSR
jgi:hypothetical protein